MSAEFETVAPNTARSVEGFSVVWRPPGAFYYSDATGTIRVDSEPLVNPRRTLVYKRSGGLKTMSDDREREILANIKRALEYLGHQVET